MKKWIGALCSGLAGVLSLIFLAIPALTIKGFGEKETYSGWKLLTDEAVGKADYAAVTWYRVFAWILVVLAIVLIVVAVLQVLANLNVIKMPEIVNTVAKYALIALAVVAVLTLVANFGIRADMLGELKEMGAPASYIKEMKKNLAVGASLWIVSIVNIAAAVCANLFAKKAK